MAVSKSISLTLVEFIVFFFSLATCILLKYDAKQQEPYMDEIFHIPQSQNFCVGHFFHWDPMITTLPGLYIITVIVFQPLTWLFNVSMITLCSVFGLRFLNVILATGNSLLFVLLTRTLHPPEKENDEWKCLVTAIALSFFPLLYFFTFLYYTDTGSTFWVLLMYYLSLRGKHVSAGLAGSISVLFRQTNIVWVVFVAGIIIEKHIINWIQPSKKDMRREDLQNFDFVLVVLRRIRNCLTQDFKQLYNFLTISLRDVWPYVVVCLAFMVFVIINGSIVVGAKEDHKVSLHFPQIFYYLSFSLGFSFMHLIAFSTLKTLFKTLRRHPVAFILITLLCIAIVWKFTVAHRYLLADNRHYTFYIWAKIYRRHELIKYLLIPMYILAGWGMLHLLWHQTGIWKLIYVVCLCVNLVPQMLLEFRYFIIPYLIYRLNMKPASLTALSLEIVLYNVVNVITIYVFLERPFLSGQDGQQRFMW